MSCVSPWGWLPREDKEKALLTGKMGLCVKTRERCAQGPPVGKSGREEGEVGGVWQAAVDEKVFSYLNVKSE